MPRDPDGIIQEKFAGAGDVGIGDVVITEGWPLAYSTPGGKDPQRLQFNQLYRWLFALAVEINQKGPYLDYNATIDYAINAGVIGSDGRVYKALAANGPGTSVVDPVGNPATWLDVFTADGVSFDDSNVPFTAAQIQTAIEKGRRSKNRIINGNFNVNQRAVSGSVVLGSGVYGHDRWKAGAGGCSYTFAISNNVTTITVSAGSLVQVVEGLNLQSGTHVLSWSGTAQGQIGGGGFGASGVTGTLTGGANATIEFDIGTLSLVQLEAGSVNTDFDHRQFDVELLLCQRYYEIGVMFHGSASFQIFATMFHYLRPYVVTKRVIPTITLTDGGAISTIDAIYPDISSLPSTSSLKSFTADAEL